MAENLTELEKKAVELAKKYDGLSMQDKVGILAQTFACSSGSVETSPCYGKWHGTNDISIQFDNGASLFLGNEPALRAQNLAVQGEYVNAALKRYNPEIVTATKENALAALRVREDADNVIAAEKGLKPYTLLNVELNDGSDAESGGFIGWYYVTLAVDGKIRAHLESGLAYEIASGKVSEAPTRERYFVAGAVKEPDVDYVFNNVGFSSASTLYSLHIGDAVLKRAEKALAERSVSPDHTQLRKPSIKAQLTAKPIPGDKPAAKFKDREAR